MSDDDIEAVNSLQEPPSTSLTELPRDLYHTLKAYINGWEPRPCPPKEGTR